MNKQTKAIPHASQMKSKSIDAKQTTHSEDSYVDRHGNTKYKADTPYPISDGEFESEFNSLFNRLSAAVQTSEEIGYKTTLFANHLHNPEYPIDDPRMKANETVPTSNPTVFTMLSYQISRLENINYVARQTADHLERTIGNL